MTHKLLEYESSRAGLHSSRLRAAHDCPQLPSADSASARGPHFEAHEIAVKSKTYLKNEEMRQEQVFTVAKA